MGRKPEDAIRDIIVILLLAITSGFLAWKFHPKKPDLDIILTEIDPLAMTYEQIKVVNPDRILWVDARTQKQYRKSHIPGAILLNEDNWDNLLGDFLENHFDPSKLIIVYCDAAQCDASRSVTVKMRDYFPDLTVYYLYGGYDTWKNAQ